MLRIKTLINVSDTRNVPQKAGLSTSLLAKRILLGIRAPLKYRAPAPGANIKANGAQLLPRPADQKPVVTRLFAYLALADSRSFSSWLIAPSAVSVSLALAAFSSSSVSPSNSAASSSCISLAHAWSDPYAAIS